MSIGLRALALFFIFVLGSGVTSAIASERVNSERSLTPPRATLPWRLATRNSAAPALVGYPEISIKRIHEVGLKNAAGDMQIGIGRVAKHEGAPESPSYLRWTRLRNGGSVARVEYTSPLALAMRVGLRVADLQPGVEFRFAGSDRREDVVATMGAAQMRRLADRKGIFWTPSTDGQSQVIEIYRPASIPESGATPRAPIISHLLGNSRNNFKLVKALGEAASCQLDTACKVPALGAAFSDAVASVVLVQYVDTDFGKTRGCTATLVADKVSGSQIPYLVAGGACNGETFQRYASTVNTFWGYEATACKSGIARAPTQLAGGAVLLIGASAAGVLIRLNEPAPSIAVFSGWDTAGLVADSPVVSIHHPNADVKKAVTGMVLGGTATENHVTWSGGGYMQGWSGGAGLFTGDADGYHLRGWASNPKTYMECGPTYVPRSPYNSDSFGRMDSMYENARPWLSPDDPESQPDFDYVHEGRTVTFRARTSPAMFDHTWFVDGHTFSGETLVWTFANPGYHEVTLRVRWGADYTAPLLYLYVRHKVPIEQTIRVNGSNPSVRGR